jgi:SPP1 gp7 family putative phage head morphogenesis protein
MAQSPPMGASHRHEPSGPSVAQVEMVLASSAPLATMVSILGRLFGGFGVTVPVIQAALAMVLKGERSMPIPGNGAAVASSLQSEAAFRAAYLINAAVRMQNAVNGAMTMTDALDAEMANYRLHLAAQLNRREAAEQADSVHDDGIAGWEAVMDAKTSPECAAANGNNFRVAEPPAIGLPGAVHPHCRCKARRPWPGGGWVNQAVNATVAGRALVH